jgi:hypothetical protein
MRPEDLCRGRQRETEEARQDGAPHGTSATRDCFPPPEAPSERTASANTGIFGNGTNGDWRTTRTDQPDENPISIRKLSASAFGRFVELVDHIYHD